MPRAKKHRPAPVDAIEQRVAVMAIEVDREALQRELEPDDEGGAPDPDDAPIPIAISSEYPVQRYDFWEDERYLEILDHGPDSVDLSRAAQGLPFLDSHNAYEGRAQLGRVENIRITADRKLRGEVRFSRRQEAQDFRQDILDGIRKEISVGYNVDRNNQQITKPDGGLKTVRVMRWTPFEVSGVSVPADPTVGAGRAELTPDAIDRISAAVARTLTSHAAPKAEEHPVPDTTVAPAGATTAGVAVTRAEGQDEMKDLAAIAERMQLSDVFAKGISSGLSPMQIRDEMIAEQKRRLDRGADAIRNPTKPIIDLTEREERGYSFARAIRAAAEGEDCFEMEVSRAIEQKLPAGPRGTGKGNRVYLPTGIRNFPEHLKAPAGWDGMTRAGLDSGTSTKGTELKFVQPGSFIEMLRNKARVLQLGATLLSGLEGPVSFPKQTGAGTFSWMGENPASAVSLSDLTLGTVSLTAKTGMSATKFSKQLLRQAVIDVENLVRNDLAAIHALGIDQAAIAGTGSSNQPLGIMTNTSVSVVALGPNGAQPAFADMVKLEVAVEKLNANTGEMGYLTTPSIKGTLKTTQIFPTSVAVPVWLGGDEGEVNGYRAYSTNQVPSNLTKGTSTTVCHAILFGVWANLMIGEWGAMEVLVDPYTLAGYGMYAVTSFQLLDIALRYPESFAVVKDALPAAGM